MKQTLVKICSIVCTLMAMTTSVSANSKADKLLQTTEVDFFNQQANRPVKIKFWYQGDKQPCNAKLCLSSQQKTDRIAVISHGAFGSPREMNWLGYALASQGWVVAGVAHFGESWVYGADNIDPSSVMRFWQRPQDVSFAIDNLSNDGLFNVALSTDKVIMFGHSAGGFTALAMSGAMLEQGKSEVYCASDSAKADKGCDYGKQGQRKPMSEQAIQKTALLQQKMQDNRIVSVIALDPALGHAASKQSLLGIKVPTLIIGSVDNDFLPYTAHAKYYADHIQHANLVGIKQGAGHFIYIDECNLEREVKGVPLCKDREGVNRQAIQQSIIGQIFNFIYSNELS